MPAWCGHFLTPLDGTSLHLRAVWDRPAP
jgi:hypothetical protein